MNSPLLSNDEFPIDPEFDLINPYVEDDHTCHKDRDFEPKDPGWIYSDRDADWRIDRQFAENPLNY